MDLSTSRIALALVMIFAPKPSSAQFESNNIRVITGLTLGVSSFSFAEKLDHDIAFESFNLPLAISSGKWQVAANISASLTHADIVEEEDLGEATRDDLDFTLGYQLTKNWTVFAGYKYAETAMVFVPRDRDEEDDEEALDPSFTEQPVNISHESYRQQGPFVGASYSWRFEKAGRLNLSVGWAKLSSNNTFAANTDEEEQETAEFDDLSGKVNGDTQGFSYALSWTMPLSTNLLFQSRFKVNQYQQDIVFEGQRFTDIDESFKTLHLGLAYVF